MKLDAALFLSSKKVARTIIQMMESLTPIYLIRVTDDRNSNKEESEKRKENIDHDYDYIFQVFKAEKAENKFIVAKYPHVAMHVCYEELCKTVAQAGVENDGWSPEEGDANDIPV